MCNWKCKECGFAGMDDYDECPFCENERLRKDHAEAQHKIGEYVDLTASLRAALERIDKHETVHLAYVQVEELKQIAREALRND